MATDIGKVGIVMKGAWSNSATYEALDAVSYNNGLYIANQDVPANTAPTNTTYWQVAAAPIVKTKSVNYPYTSATTSGTVYTVNNAKTDVFGLSSGDTVLGFIANLVEGNQNRCYNMAPTYNVTANTFVFVPTANNSTTVRFYGTVFYT